MKLITEEITQCQFIVEEIGGKKNMFIEGIFLQGNIKNRNGRMYRTETLAREVGRYVKEKVEHGSAVGELGHPEGPTVNLDRVSHKIVSLRQEGNNFIGKAKLIDTPMGKIAKSLIGEGVTLGVSSRGVGSLRQDRAGYKVVGEDFVLATAADIVADPSAPEAFVQGIMEGKDWVYHGSDRFAEQNVSYTKQYLNSAASQRQSLSEAQIQAYAGYLDRMSKFYR